MRLASFGLSSFKSVGPEGALISVKPITVLVGPNGAGKSCSLEGLAFLAQQQRSPTFTYNGEFVSYDNPQETAFGLRPVPSEFILDFRMEPADLVRIDEHIDSMQMFYGHTSPRRTETSKVQGPDDMRAAVVADTIRRWASRLAAGARHRHQYREGVADRMGCSVTATIGPTPMDYRVSVQASTSTSSSQEFLPPIPDLNISWSFVHPANGAPTASYRVENCLLESRLAFPMESFMRRCNQFWSFPTYDSIRDMDGPPDARSANESSRSHDAENTAYLQVFPMLEESVMNALWKVYYLRAPRAEVSTWAEVGQVPTWVGTTEGQLVRFLAALWSDRQRKDAKQAICTWAAKFGIHDLSAAWQGANRLRVDYEDGVTKATLGARALGFGSRQVLPIIVQGFAAPRGSYLLIEEPEISVHPDGQLDILEMFAEFVKAGKHVIFSTHSSTMLLGLSKLVRDFGIEADDIAVYRVAKSRQGSHYEPVRLDRHGFVVGWDHTSFAKSENDLLDVWRRSLDEQVGK